MKLRVLISPEARKTFVEHLVSLQARSPAAARLLRDELFALLDLVAGGGFDGMSYTLPSGEVTRRLVLGHFLIFYVREPKVLRVVLIHDARQRPLDP